MARITLSRFRWTWLLVVLNLIPCLLLLGMYPVWVWLPTYPLDVAHMDVTLTCRPYPRVLITGELAESGVRIRSLSAFSIGRDLTVRLKGGVAMPWEPDNGRAFEEEYPLFGPGNAPKYQRVVLIYSNSAMPGSRNLPDENYHVHPNCSIEEATPPTK